MVRNKLRAIVLHWDHLLPFAFSYNNTDGNFVAACSICNHIKRDRIFDKIQDAIEYVRDHRRKHKIPTTHHPMCSLWKVVPTQEAVAKILPIKVQGRTFLDDA